MGILHMIWKGRNLHTFITRPYANSDKFRPILFLVGDNGIVNSKELFFIDCVFKSTPVYSTTFMLAHMRSVSNEKRGPISIGGLITSIAYTLHDTELATIVPLANSNALDIHSCQEHRVIKYNSVGRYYLMINNTLVMSVVLPLPMCTDVQVNANYLYDIYVGDDANDIPMDVDLVERLVMC